MELIGDEGGCVRSEIRRPLVSVAEDTESMLNGPQRVEGTAGEVGLRHLPGEFRVEALEDLLDRGIWDAIWSPMPASVGSRCRHMNVLIPLAKHLEGLHPLPHPLPVHDHRR